jgi:hypothetical protein
MTCILYPTTHTQGSEIKKKLTQQFSRSVSRSTPPINLQHKHTLVYVHS